MARFNVLSFLFLLVFVVSFLFSTDFSMTGNSIKESFSYVDFWDIFTIFSFVMFLVVFLSGKKLEAILVPTGTHEADRERAKKGAKYYHEHEDREPEVLVSGSHDVQPFLSSQPGHIYKYLRKGKVPREDIIFEPYSKNTAENVVYSCDVIRKEGIKRIDVVSNPSHLWRFRYLFDKAKDEGLIDKDVKIGYIPTRRNFLFEDVKDGVYGIMHYLYYLWKWKDKSLKSLKRKSS